MKNLTKFALFAALCGVFVACGDDSSTSAENGGSESVATSSASRVILSGGSAEVEESSSSEVSSSSVVEVVDPSSVIKGTMTDERDGKVYKTVTIGEQTWMAENLNYAYLQKTAEEDSSSFCYYNKPDNCAKYGRLYLWSAAMDSAAVFSDDGKGCGFDVKCGADGIVRGVCPEGWHLPNATEWSTLSTAVGGDTVAGTMLKSTSGWSDSDVDKGVDSYGFSVLPAGYRIYYGYFLNAGNDAYFWSSTEYDSDFAYYWYFYYNYASVYEDSRNKNNAFSVRCVRD